MFSPRFLCPCLFFCVSSTSLTPSPFFVFVIREWMCKCINVFYVCARECEYMWVSMRVCTYEMREKVCAWICQWVYNICKCLWWTPDKSLLALTLCSLPTLSPSPSLSFDVKIRAGETTLVVYAPVIWSCLRALCLSFSLRGLSLSLSYSRVYPSQIWA